MIDDALMGEIERAVARVGDVTRLHQSAGEGVLDVLAARYIADRSKLWWWEGLRDRPVVISYGSSLAWAWITRIVPSDSGLTYFIPTDDEPEPWPVYVGALGSVCRVLESIWRCEYVIAAQDLSWLVFDTHHNALVVCGDARVGASTLLKTMDM